MKISLKFLENRLSAMHIRTEVLLNSLSNPVFNTFTIYHGQFAQDETLYFCPSGTPRSVFHGISSEKNIGIVWVDSEIEPPRNIPVLWFKNISDDYEAINKIGEIFQFYQHWSSKVKQYMLEQRSLPEIFSLLDEVTPNPYYLCDCSFRMQAIRKDQDMEEMSIIWRYQYRHGHLPIQLILELEENGLLDLMNKMRQAFIVSKPAPFTLPFISKTIHHSEGIIGHFYIAGIYTRLCEYEIEIAEFFGNLVTKMLSQNKNVLPTLGRFYDNYFIDLIEGIDPGNLDMLEKVFRKIHWNINDVFYLAVLGKTNNEANQKSLQDLQIQILEAQITAKAFLYRGQVVVLINSSKLKNPKLLPEDELIREQLRTVLSDFGCASGISESFSGMSAFENLNISYYQGHKALQFALKSSEPLPLFMYTEIAIEHLCEQLVLSKEADLFLHPAIRILQKYDAANGTDLIKTLKQYLICGENVVRTAKALYIHRNSLMYRLDKIQQLTAINLSDIQERIRLFLTLQVIYGHTSE